MGADVTAITVAFTSDLADEQERMRLLPVSRQARGRVKHGLAYIAHAVCDDGLPAAPPPG
jgi:hypothetical protein